MADSSLARKKSNSFDLVRKEIEHTIQQAESTLERFQENRESGEDLQNCIDFLNQLRGIFTLIELQGGTVLCQESVALANEVPVGAMEDKNGLLASLSQALFVMHRYVEYFANRREDHPELLLPIINDLRLARKAKPLPDSYFFEMELPRQAPAAVENLDVPADAFEKRARHLRHMYQVGLLDLLRSRNATIGFRLLHRASEGFSKLCGKTPLGFFWGTAGTAGRVMLAGNMELTKSRKRLLMRIEKYGRELVQIGKVAATRNASETVLKELVYIIALSGVDDEPVRSILKQFNIDPPEFNERKLVSHRSQLMGPGKDVLKSLASALQEELSHLKDKLDIVERGVDVQETDYGAIAAELGRLADTLIMLDLKKLSDHTREQQQLLLAWEKNRTTPNEQELLAVADAVLSIEQAIMKLEDRGITQETDHLITTARVQDSPYLAEAHIVVIGEAQAALSLAKRAIVAFIESAGDKMHLVNVPTTLHGIWGSLLMIESPKVAALVSLSARYIQERLIDSEQAPDQHSLETLADALTSLEYFIESLNKEGEGNEELLQLAEESLRSFGYET